MPSARGVLLVALTAGFALGGCSANPSISVPVQTLGAVASSGPVADQPGMALVVQPTLQACDGPGNGAYQASVAWRLSGTPATPVVVRIKAQTGVLFAQAAGVTGQAATGKWVTSGLAFYLLDGHGAVLASASAPASPC
jgi:hypothetical protein